MPSTRVAAIAALALMINYSIASPAAAKTTRSACQAPVVSALKKYSASASFCTSFDQINTQTEYVVAWASNTITRDADCNIPTTTAASSPAITPATTNTQLGKRATKSATKTDIPAPLRKYASASLSSACDCLSFATPTVTETDTYTSTIGPPYCTGNAYGPEEFTVDISIDDNYLGGSTIYWNGYSPDEYILTGYPNGWWQLYNDGTYAHVADPVNGGVLNFTTDDAGAGFKLHCDLESTYHVVCYNANITPFIYYVYDNDNTTLRLGLTVPANASQHQVYYGY